MSDENELIEYEEKDHVPDKLEQKINVFDRDYESIRNNYLTLISRANSTLEKMQELIFELDEPTKYVCFLESIKMTAELNEKLNRHNISYEKSERMKTSIKEKSKKDNSNKKTFNASQQGMFKILQKLVQGADLDSQIVDITPTQREETIIVNNHTKKVIEKDKL